MTEAERLAEIEAMIYRSSEGIEWGTYEAARMGDIAEPILIRAAEHEDRYIRVAAARRLVHLSGDSSLTLLREMVCATGPGSQDLQMVSVGGLARRLQGKSEPDLLNALKSRSTKPHTKDLAAYCLGLWGSSGRGWDEALEHVRKRASAKSRAFNSSVPVDGSLFLMRLANGDPGRHAKLVSMVRGIWSHLHEHEIEWFDQFWPAVSPEGPAAVEMPAIRDLSVETERLRVGFLLKAKLTPPEAWVADPFDRDGWSNFG